MNNPWAEIKRPQSPRFLGIASETRNLWWAIDVSGRYILYLQYTNSIKRNRPLPKFREIEVQERRINKGENRCLDSSLRELFQQLCIDVIKACETNQESLCLTLRELSDTAQKALCACQSKPKRV